MLRPGIVGMRGSMIIHTTMAMHENEYTSPIEYTPPPILFAVIHMLESPPHTRFLAGCSSPSMRLAGHLTALCAWRKHCLPGRSKIDVLRPGIVGMRGSTAARTTAMHDTRTPLSLSSLPPFLPQSLLYLPFPSLPFAQRNAMQAPMGDLLSEMSPDATPAVYPVWRYTCSSIIYFPWFFLMVAGSK